MFAIVWIVDKFAKIIANILNCIQIKRLVNLNKISNRVVKKAAIQSESYFSRKEIMYVVRTAIMFFKENFRWT